MRRAPAGDGAEGCDMFEKFDLAGADAAIGIEIDAKAQLGHGGAILRQAACSARTSSRATAMDLTTAKQDVPGASPSTRTERAVSCARIWLPPTSRRTITPGPRRRCRLPSRWPGAC